MKPYTSRVCEWERRVCGVGDGRGNWWDEEEVDGRLGTVLRPIDHYAERAFEEMDWCK